LISPEINVAKIRLFSFHNVPYCGWTGLFVALLQQK